VSKILVTGSSGFIGQALCKVLYDEGHKLQLMNRARGDIADAKTFNTIEKVDHVFNLAVPSGSFVPESWQNPDVFIRVTVQGVTNILEFCRKSGARLTHISSYLYGAPDKLPIPENAPLRPNNPYAFSKYLSEQVCEFYAKYFDINIVVIRGFNIYGPDQDQDFLIPRIVDQVLKGREIIVEDVKPKRDFVFIDDFIRALLMTMSVTSSFEVINIGSGKSYSVGEVIELTQEIAGTRLPIINKNKSRVNEINDVVADISKAQEVLGWTPEHSLRQGLQKIVSK
jgi:nucleoside-diphosphate-sugar epimerase